MSPESLSYSFSDGSLWQIFASVSDPKLPLLLFLHCLHLTQILWSWQNHARCCCATSSKLQQRRLVSDQELRRSGTERAWQDRDVLAGLLRRLCSQRWSQHWSHSHGRHSFRCPQVQYAGPILLHPSLSSISSFFFFDFLALVWRRKFFFFWEEISRNIIKKINGKISGRTYSVQTDHGNKMSLSLLKHGPDSEPGPSPEGRLCPSFDFFFLRRSFDFIGLPLKIV